MSRLPPDVSRAVTHVKIETTIDAPPQTVWNALLDFPAYPKWNPYVRFQAIADSSFEPLSDHPRPTEGSNLVMRTRMPPRGVDDDDKGLSTSREVITYVDEENRRLAWRFVSSPSWLLKVERWQEVTEEEVDGRAVAKYTSIEAFNGPVAWLVRWFFRANIVVSYEAMAEGLKTWSEERAREV